MDEDVIGLLSQLQNMNKTIVITSDTSYSKKNFFDFLEHLKITPFIDNIYLSSEIKLNKASERLFKHICEAESVSFNKIVHVGDNVYSDITVPETLGMSAVLYCPEITLSSEHRTVLYQFGYEVLAPVIIDFCSELQTEVKEDSTLIFLGRDGYLLHSVYNSIFEESNNNHYLYLNRVLANQIYYSELNESLCDYIRSEHKSEGVWGLVSIFGLYETSFAVQLVNFLTENKVNQETFLEEQIVNKLLAIPTMVRSFNESILERRSNNLRYIEQFVSLKNGESVEIIDVGWRGEIFKKISHQYSSVLQAHLLCSSSSNQNVHGYITRSKKNKEFFSIVSEYRDLLEFVLSDSVASILYIDNELNPVLNRDKFNQDNENNIRNLIQNAILDRCKAVKIEPLKDRDTIRPETTFHRSNNLQNLSKFLTSMPPSFVDAVGMFEIANSINGTSSVTFNDVLPTDRGQSTSINDMKNIQSMLYCFLKMINELRRSNELVIYGAGSGAEFILPHLSEQCDFIVDINNKIHGQKVQGVEIRPLEELQQFQGTVLVSVIGRKNQIAGVLDKYPVNIIFLEDYL